MISLRRKISLADLFYSNYRKGEEDFVSLGLQGFWKENENAMSVLERSELHGQLPGVE